MKDEPESDDELSIGATRRHDAKRTSAPKSATSSRNGARSKAVKHSTEDEDNAEAESAETSGEDASKASEPVKPKRANASRSGPRVKAAPKTKSSIAHGKKATLFRRVETPDESEGDEPHGEVLEEIESGHSQHGSTSRRESSQPAPKSKATTSSSRGARRQAAVESDDDIQSNASELQPDADAKSEPPPKDAPDISVAPQSSDEEDLLPQASLRASAAPPSRIGGSVPPSRIGRVSLAGSVAPPTIMEAGPKSRLVIHKMALVNFKSYKGRQEIGPFHKVRGNSILYQRPDDNCVLLVVLCHSRSEWIWEIEHN